MPLRLIDKSLFHRSFFKILYEIPISTAGGPTTPSSCVRGATIRMAVRRRWVIRWTWLKSDRCIGIKMAYDSLNGRRNTALLLV